MTEKRFREVVSIKTIKDNQTGIAYVPCLVHDDFLELVNNLAKENEQLKFDYETLKIQDDTRKQHQKKLIEENGGLKAQLESLEKQCHLIHMQSMFSTVKSFKGDVSKRYNYSEETDDIYDTANHYGQHNKVLGKKEIVMLLNEYETILRELEE